VSDPDKDIPEESRRLVTVRDHGRCVRCMGPGTDWHHRRSRRVREAHRHCPCNGVLLCRSDHRWAHDNPEEARASGLIVSQWMDEPFIVPQLRFDGWWMLLCTGGGLGLSEMHVMTDGMGGYVVTQEVCSTGLITPDPIE
jgi:hypothetical protein